MNRQLVWTSLQWPGCEHLDLRIGDDGQVVADGLVIALVDGWPVRLHYQLVCDAAWTTTSVMVDVRGRPSVSLERRAGDRWFDQEGREHAELAGCVDVDITLTPFTNTLPIRRLGLNRGESADLHAVYFQVEPELDVSVAEQRYTRLEHGANAEFRYQSGTFSADLRVDSDGIVSDYPQLWTLHDVAP
jgi:hypothetical protein